MSYAIQAVLDGVDERTKHLGFGDEVYDSCVEADEMLRSLLKLPGSDKLAIHRGIAEIHMRMAVCSNLDTAFLKCPLRIVK